MQTIKRAVREYSTMFLNKQNEDYIISVSIYDDEGCYRADRSGDVFKTNDINKAIDSFEAGCKHFGFVIL